MGVGERTTKALFQALWIFALILLASFCFPQVPTWPMFFLDIFRTVYQRQKSVPQLMAHALTGLAVALLYVLAARGLFARFETKWSLLLPLLPALMTILFGCLFLPRAFGIVSFGYFTAALIDSSCLDRPLLLLFALLLGAPLLTTVSHGGEKMIERYFISKES